MVKVIGRDDRHVKEISCDKCASRLQYTESEVRNLWSGTDYGGGPDGADGFDCPNCGNQVHVRRW